jgi:enediyne biosynthesis protein E4
MRILRPFLYFAIFIFLVSCSKKEETVFDLLDSSQTNVTFNNKITDSDTFNILNYEYIYNGGGVALADFNNDGLDDIFFTGNMVSNEIYLNKGKLQFENVTKTSGITSNRWCSGVNIVDINQDGKKDIFVTVTTNAHSTDSRDLLYINQSAGKDIKFVEQAQAYGLADSSYSTNAAFFDYDNDGDLDMYLLNNKMNTKDVSRYSIPKNDRASGKVDKLFRNDLDMVKGHPVFTDVSEKAGINIEGYSLGINIVDINLDGWQDIYISNDFLSNNIFFINNKNGTFTNRLSEILMHTSFSEMGNDIVDINNDGLNDIFAVDMLPYDNYRRKTMLAPNSYFSYQSNNDYQYTHQLVRNTLQLNRGSIGDQLPTFSDVACLSGLEATDWSWTPMVADFDADGLKDVIITNGFPKDITDKDFADYRSEYHNFISAKDMLSKVPEVKLKNFAFKNKGDLTFENVSTAWGITQPTFSNGAAYSDLDKDGDLDYVVNNINDIAHIYKNNTADRKKTNYIKINLKAESPNQDAIGAVINYRTKNLQSTYHHNPGRGYLSTVSHEIFIGLGQDSLVDIDVIWPGGLLQKFPQIKSGQTYNLAMDKAKCSKYDYSAKSDSTIFFAESIIPRDTMKEYDNIDYNSDPLLFKKLSNLGPGIAVGDVNGDKLEDYYVTGGKGANGLLYLQSPSGFKSRMLKEAPVDREELSPLFLDIDMDGDLDLYIGCGSIEYNEADPNLKDLLMINDGRGNFIEMSASLPVPNINTACVKASDYDDDGDVDLFIGGKSIPTKYPSAEVSFIIKNNSKPGNLSFTVDKSSFDQNKMMVSDALWTDYDNDNKTDLIVVGEYNSVQIYKNINNHLILQKGTGVEDKYGLFNSINGGDFDNDGDIDYVIGNYGLNGILQASEKYPINIYAKDFDNNGSYDFIPTFYIVNNTGQMKEAPFHVKGDLTKELNGFRKKFINYSKLGLSPIDSIITPDMRKGAKILQANYLSSAIMINNGKGKFTIQALPQIAQVSPIYGSMVEDFDLDGNLDIICIGNNYGTELTTGRLDAGKGLYLRGNGNGTFLPIPYNRSGLNLPYDSRNLTSISIGSSKLSYVLTNYREGTLGLKTKLVYKLFSLPKGCKKYVLKDINDKIIKYSEYYMGSGSQSQKSSFISLPRNTAKIIIGKEEKVI